MQRQTLLQKLEKKLVGQTIQEVKVYGKSPIQPGGPLPVVRAVEQSIHGVIKISYAIQPEPGKPDGAHVQIALGDPSELRIARNMVAIRKASYVRFEELIAVAKGTSVSLSLAGTPGGKGLPGAVALMLHLSDS